MDRHFQGMKGDFCLSTYLSIMYRVPVVVERFGIACSLSVLDHDLPLHTGDRQLVS